MLPRLISDLLRAIRRRAGVGRHEPDLGAALRQAMEKRSAGEFAVAEEMLRAAAFAYPAEASTHALLANLLDSRGRLGEAREHYERALRIDPLQPELRLVYAALLQRLEAYAEAESHYDRVVLERPEWVVGYLNYGLAVLERGHWTKALGLLVHAAALAPGMVEAHVNLATAFRAVGATRRAVDHCEIALRLAPANVAALQNIAALHYDMGDSEKECAALLERAAVSGSDGARIAAACAVPAISDSREEIQSIRMRLARNLARLKSERLDVHDPASDIGITPFYLAYHGKNDRSLQESLAALHRLACPSLDYVAPHCDGGRSPSNERIRIGVVSASLYNHSVGIVTEGLLTKLDPERFSVTAFGIRPPFDSVSGAIAENAAEWVTLPRELAAARQAVARRELDVVFHPDIGPDPFTYFMAFARLAPVQFTSWGHPVTSGVPTIDYAVSTNYFDTDDAQDHYSECLVRLRDIALPGYLRVPPKLAPVCQTTLGFDRGRHVYFCAQSLIKFHPDFDAILAAILSKDRKGEIVIAYDEDRDAYRVKRLQARLLRVLGARYERVVFLPRMPGREGFLHRLQACDVALDTLHYGGGTTSLDAIALGTPMVTLPSAFNRGRHTYGFLRKIGCTETVASSPEEYVDLAVRIATDGEYRMYLKDRLHESAGALYEDRSAVDQIEAFMVQAVNEARRAGTPRLQA